MQGDAVGEGAHVPGRTPVALRMETRRPWPWASFAAGDVVCHVAGRLRIGGESFEDEPAARALCDFVTKLDPSRLEAALRELAAAQPEDWAMAVAAGAQAFAAVDHVRAYPLFHAMHDGQVLLSNSGLRLREETGAARDPWSVREMRMCGFVGGPRTLYEGVLQLEAGRWLCAGPDGAVRSGAHFDYFPSQVFEGDEDAALSALDEVHRRTFDRLVESLDGRTAVIPLSAGKDSRLVLGSLMDRGYKDIWCYSHGTAENAEVRWVAEMTRRLGIDWRHVAYDREFIGRVTRSEEWRRYTLWASQGAAVPAGVDCFSIMEMQRLGQLPPSPVFVNGQSGDFLNGDQVPRDILGPDQGPLDFERWLRPVVNKHYALWPRELRENLEEIVRRLRAEQRGVDAFPVSEQEAVWCWDRLNWRERQAKYIVNGQRMYEWFGLPWLLPLWDREFVEFWRDVPLTMKKRQALFVRWLETRDPGGLFSTGIPLGKPKFPAPLFLANALYHKTAKLLGCDPELFRRAVLVWFGDYRLYYPQRTFLEFLRDSAHHRNYVSYLARDILGVLP